MSGILYEKRDHIAYLTIDRPESGNRLNIDAAQDLVEVCAEVNEDDEIYVVLLTGSGDLFCAGSDAGLSVAESVAGIEKPVVAAINGDALGCGLEIALACDLRIASESAKFGFPWLADGAMPSDGATQRLPRLIGKGKAMELILTAETLSAAEAFDIGLVSSVYPAADLAAEAEKLVRGISTKAPVSLRYVKEAVNKGMDMTMDQGLRLEADLYIHLHTTSDRTEGITAFLEKRTPEFKGE